MQWYFNRYGLTWEFTVSDGDDYFWSGHTGENADVTILDLLPGDYTITETLKPGWECTDPGSSLEKNVTVKCGKTTTVLFGNKKLPRNSFNGSIEGVPQQDFAEMRAWLEEILSDTNSTREDLELAKTLQDGIDNMHEQ